MKNHKIFIIEDNESISKLIKKSIVESIKHSEVFLYPSVERALGNVNEKPDYIILDHFLEKTNGIDSIPVFREFLPDTKIIVVSTQNDIKTFENAYLYGATEYFRKDGLLIHNIVDFIKKDLESEEESWLTSFFSSVKSTNKLKASGRIVYVLEDNPSTAFSIEHILQNESLDKVYTFTNSSDFFAQLKIAKPDVVVLDFNLEEKITGSDVLKHIKVVSPNTLVVMYSGQTDVINATELMHNGASYYLTKSKENLLKLKSMLN